MAAESTWLSNAALLSAFRQLGDLTHKTLGGFLGMGAPALLRLSRQLGHLTPALHACWHTEQNDILSAARPGAASICNFTRGRKLVKSLPRSCQFHFQSSAQTFHILASNPPCSRRRFTPFRGYPRS